MSQAQDEMKKPDKETIKNVLADFRSEVPDFEINPRNFTFEEFGNYVLVGIRRAGKSFLLYQRMQELLAQGKLQDDFLYINFEDERLTGMTVNDLNLLLEIHLELYGKKPILFLDEIQNIDGWENFARRLADSKFRVYITGSNAKMLSKDIQTTLGGRYITVEVYPYSFKEFLKANDVDFSEQALSSTRGKSEMLQKFNDYFYFGGFPEGAKLSVKRDYLTSVYQKVYLGDIALRHSVENTFALRIMVKKLAESIKQPISFNRLSNIIATTGAKVGTSTVINYLEYAKDAWLIMQVQNIADKLVEKETKPKYYFIDNGILNLFLIDGNTSLLENLVAITLFRKFGRNDSVFFYHRNIEVDFYIPEQHLAIQVCFNLHHSDETFARETNALLKISEVLDCQKLLIITKDTEEQLTIKGKTIEVIPIWKWLLQNGIEPANFR